MGALKQWAMSGQGIAAAQAALVRAEARWAHLCAACALAARHVDAATLDDLTFAAARDLGEAHEGLAMACGYETAHDMVR